MSVARANRYAGPDQHPELLCFIALAVVRHPVLAGGLVVALGMPVFEWLAVPAAPLVVLATALAAAPVLSAGVVPSAANVATLALPTWQEPPI